jgi:hypothetical protein
MGPWKHRQTRAEHIRGLAVSGIHELR